MWATWILLAVTLGGMGFMVRFLVAMCVDGRHAHTCELISLGMQRGDAFRPSERNTGAATAERSA